MLTSLEGVPASFEEVLRILAHGLSIEPSDTVRNGPAILAIAFQGDHEFGVSENRNIGVMCVLTIT